MSIVCSDPHAKANNLFRIKSAGISINVIAYVIISSPNECTKQIIIFVIARTNCRKLYNGFKFKMEAYCISFHGAKLT